MRQQWRIHSGGEGRWYQTWFGSHLFLDWYFTEMVMAHSKSWPSYPPWVTVPKRIDNEKRIVSVIYWLRIETRLHSSRMHTTRLLTVSPSMHCTGGSAPGGISASGGLLPGGGGSAPGAVGIPACTEADTPRQIAPPPGRHPLGRHPP